LTISLRPHQQRACDAMLKHDLGQIIVPTGGGKTITMIQDTITTHNAINSGTTTVVVAPRILLAEQLCSEFLELIDTKNVHVMHVHSGETHHFSSTKADQIHMFANVARTAGDSCIIFTTYHSLHKVQQADIEVNTIYFDESHNSVTRNFFPATEHFSNAADRCYFFTATPKHSATVMKPGMNDREVYGDVICQVPAPELINNGFIIPPKVVVNELDNADLFADVPARDSAHLIKTIDETGADKALICSKSTKNIVNLIGQSDFTFQLEIRGYSYMYITAKTGAVIDGRKVNREVFFETLSAWGKDNEKKFVVLHHSILSEGINVSGLNAVIFMRSMDYIGISQTIGRVIRLHKDDAEGLRNGSIIPGKLDQYTKSFGLVCVPTYNKVGIQTAQKIQTVVDIVFEQGGAAVSTIKR